MDPAITQANPAVGNACETRGPESDSVAPVSFVAFCLECYKARHGLTGAAAAELFRRYGVEQYLFGEYDVLHSFGERQILDDIERFIEVRQEAQA